MRILKQQKICFLRILAPLAVAGLVSACVGGLGYVPPPGAKLGDGFLSLTISTKDHSRMPQGADVVIHIENSLETEADRRIIIGDVVQLSMADTAVKVNFPIDQHLLNECGSKKVCLVVVKVVKQGKVRYISSPGLSYQAGMKKGKIELSRS